MESMFLFKYAESANKNSTELRFMCEVGQPGFAKV